MIVSDERAWIPLSRSKDLREEEVGIPEGIPARLDGFVLT
jgi:hypothetical protein